MNFNNFVFVKSVFSLEDLPNDDLLEIGFIGRSNVGKSSLLNAVLGSSKMARVSNTPGRTQSLNFFELSKKLYLVDMPGYGYAKAPKTLVKKWTSLMKSYLLGRQTLRRVFLLVDARHGLKKNDVDMMTLLDKTAVPYQVVLTKIDKISPLQLVDIQEATRTLCQKHGACHPHLLSTSSEKGVGISDVRSEIMSFFEDIPCINGD